MKRLEGKAALITGGSRGIGAAIALRFAREGAQVAVTYFNTPEGATRTVEQARSLGVRAEAIRADAACADATRAAVRRARSLCGRLDILVNNAGVMDRRRLPETTDADYDRIMAINVKSVYAASREAAALMGQGGRIINIGSTFGARVPGPGLGLYAVSKFAVAGLTRAYARDLAGRGITVNCIQPGPIDTDMNPKESRHSKLMTLMAALGRYGEPEEVAAMAAFLASDEASLITGAMFNVDGGF